MANPRPPGSVPPLSSKLTLLALGFAGLVIVLAVWVLVPPGGHPSHDPGAAPTTSPTPPVTASPHPTPVTAEAPGTGAGLTSAPTDVTWQLYDSVAVPYSKSAGPASVARDGSVSGFAHDPEGALVALVQIAVRHLLAPDWQAVVEADVAAGPGRKSYVALREAAEKTAQMPSVPGHYLQVAGFSFVSYSSSAASINVVSRSTTGGYQVVTETVVWQGGDWKLQLEPDGSAAPVAEPVSSLAGYVVWGGV